jgi:hypothetical protein
VGGVQHQLRPADGEGVHRHKGIRTVQEPQALRAQQAQKAEASLKARKVSVKDAKMNELLLYMPGFVKESVSFNKDIAAKLGVYESHLEIVRAALKKLLDSQEFEID